MSARVPPSPCPTCGQVCDSAIDTVANDAPSPGDVSICFHCTSILVFDDALRTRAMTDAELAALNEETRDEIAVWRTRIARRKSR